jgi:hypothetical protein
MELLREDHTWPITIQATKRAHMQHTCTTCAHGTRWFIVVIHGSQSPSQWLCVLLFICLQTDCRGHASASTVLRLAAAEAQSETIGNSNRKKLHIPRSHRRADLLWGKKGRPKLPHPCPSTPIIRSRIESRRPVEERCAPPICSSKRMPKIMHVVDAARGRKRGKKRGSENAWWGRLRRPGRAWRSRQLRGRRPLPWEAVSIATLEKQIRCSPGGR